MNCYQLDRPEKGFCQIINNLHNEQKATRKDVERLEKMFKQINVQVAQTKINQDKLELHQYSKELENKNLQPFNIFFLVVLSHGTHGDKLVCSSGLFDIEEFVEAIGKNKTMIGYPKILIFDFCRGADLNLGELKDSSKTRIPIGSDICIGFSTTKGLFIESIGGTVCSFIGPLQVVLNPKQQ